MQEAKFKEGMKQDRSEFSPERAYYLAYDPPACAMANKHQDRFQLFCGKERNGKKTKWASEWTLPSECGKVIIRV